MVAKPDWSDEALRARPDRADHESRASIDAWIVDDTGFPKKGRPSVGVARQYCGQPDRGEGVGATAEASLLIAYRLYLSKDWAEGPAKRAGVPEVLTFATNPMIAQIEPALAADVSRGVGLTDAGYGTTMQFRAGLLEPELAHVVGVQPHARVWAEGKEPWPAKPWSGRGRSVCRERPGGT